MEQKEEKDKKKKFQPPTPTYTRIDPNANKGYTRPTPEVKSNIVVSQADLTPVQTQPQARPMIQSKGALAALQPKSNAQQQKQQTLDYLDSPLSMTSTISDQRDTMSKGMTPGLPVTPPTGFLMNKLTPNAPLSTPNVPVAPAPQKPAPGRDIPIIGPILSGLDKVQQATLPFAQGAASALGIPLAPTERIENNPLNSTMDKILYGAGMVGGGFTNPAALEQNLVTAPYKAAGAIVNRVAPNAGKVANRAATGALAGAGTGGAYSLISGQSDVQDVARNAALGAGIGAVGDVAIGAAGDFISKLLRRNNVPEEQIQEILALPMGSNDAQLARGARGEAITLPMGRGDAARMARQNVVQTPDVIHGNPPAPLGLPQGRPLGLPAPNIAPPTTARIAQKVNPYRQQFEDLMLRAQEEQAAGRLSPGREDLEVESMWSQMAGPEGITLDELIQRAYPTRPNRVNPDSISQARQYQEAREVAGAPMPVKSMADRYPQGGQTGIPDMPITVPARAPVSAPKAKQSRVAASSRQPIKSKGALSNASGGRQQIQSKGALSGGSAKKSTTLPPAAQRTKEVVDQAQTKVEATPSDTPLTRPDVDDTAIVRGSMESAAASEPAFVNTVRQSGNTSPELQRALNEAKITAARTTDQRNLELAEKMIARDGVESAADHIINKKGALNSVENTAASVIAKYYADTGQLERAVQIISKTASSGRELGQAMQALTRWNKLSTEGALLMAERQLNRLTNKTEEWKSLTPDQAAPVAEVGNKLESVQAASQFAEEVTRMIAGRQKGAPFTAAEKDLIEQFSEQVRKTSEEVRPLVNKQRAQNNKDIAEVSRVKPKDRTRDQVQRLISAQADKARERLAASRNRLSSTPLDVWRDYVILGADYITKKTIKFADWSEAMIKEGMTKNLGKAYTDSVRKFRKENGLPASDELDRVVRRALKEKQIDDETASSLQAMASEIGFFADDVKLEMTQELQKAMRGLGTSTLGEKISSVQVGEMLLSVPTFLRNTVGNWGQMVLEKISKVAAVPIDWGFSKLTGERTIQFLPKNQEKYWRNFGVGAKSGWTGIDPQGSLNSYNLTPNVFQSNKNPLKWLVQLTGASLKSGDHASYMAAYGDLVATYAEQLGKARGLSKAEIKQQMPQLVKQLDDNIYDLADQAGLYATYQDETLLSKGAQGLRRALNSPTNAVFRNLREKGLHPNLSLEGFGLGDVVLKFAKTPANLIMRGIDYSPIGFVRGMYELLPLVTGNVKNFNQYQATRSLSRAITGTLGLTGLGFILAKEGILTGAASNNPNVRSLQEQTGQGAYKANLTSLKRWVMSGFNPEEAKYQQGDLLMDYNWLQPAAVSVGMGVNLAENLAKPDKPGREVPEWKKYSGAIIGGLRTILENPMLTGVQDIVDSANKAVENQDVTGFTNIAKNIPASFVPAIAGQWRTGMDAAQRETSDVNPLKAMFNLIKNKAPWASEYLPQSYDSLGNERKRYNFVEPNTIGSYLNSFLNPAKFSSYKPDKDAQLILDLLQQTNDTSIIPKIAKKYLEYTDPKTKVETRADLTNEEFSNLQKRLGELVSEQLLSNESYLSSPQITADLKAKRIKKILTDSGSKARNEYRKSKGYPEKR